MIRPLTEDLCHSLRFDTFPTRSATIVDFGIDTTLHYAALQSAFKNPNEMVTPAVLDVALGDGPALTKLVKEHAGEQFSGVVFKTPYDDMLEEM